MAPYPYEYEDGEPLEGDTDQSVCVSLVVSMAKFLDNFLDQPPQDMHGEYLEDQTLAWRAVREPVNGICQKLFGLSRNALEGAGLFGTALRAKFRQVRDAIADFKKLRNKFRAARVFHIGASILASIASVFGAVEALKEAFEGLKYLADIALDESRG